MGSGMTNDVTDGHWTRLYLSRVTWQLMHYNDGMLHGILNSFLMKVKKKDGGENLKLPNETNMF